MKITGKKITLTAIAVLFVCILVGAAYVVTNRQNNEPEEVILNNDYRDFDEIADEQWNNGKLNICLITKTYGTEYWDILIQGAEESAQDSDVNLYFAGVARENNFAGLAMLMEHAMKLEPDAIIVSPADDPQINAVVEEIREKGIPLLFVDTVLNGKKYDACFITDNMEAGRMVAWDMLAKLRLMGHEDTEQIEIGIDIGSKQSQTIIERLAGFNEYWCGHAPDNWKIIESIKCNEGSADIAYAQCLEFIDNYSNLCGLIGLNNGSTVGLCKGLVDRNRKDIVLIGFDYSTEIASLIEGDEFVVATMVQQQYDMGYGSVKEAISICEGNTPEYKYNNTGVIRVDHSNFDNYYIKSKIFK